jgi:hypothetical protein
MANLSKDLIAQLNEFPLRKLRETLYILASEDIDSPFIPLQLRYPAFGFKKKGKLKMGLKDLDLNAFKKELESLSENTALGRYAERLLAIWFKYNPHFELLKFNFQIIIGKRTIGEIDYLLLEKESSNAIQLEFALKYFLAIEQEGKVNFIGPKGRDSLEAKSKKLIEQQMQMSLNHSEQLGEEIRDLDFRPQIMMKGELFHPFNKVKEDNLWLYLKDIDQLAQWGASTEFVILKLRRDWLFPFDVELWDAPLSADDCILEIKAMKSQIPLMVAYKARNGEYGRLMIVANHWPKLN